MRSTRRTFLQSGPVGLAGIWGAACPGAAQAVAGQTVGWDRVPEILARIRPPTFPDRTFDITAFGARDAAGRDATEVSADAAACRVAERDERTKSQRPAPARVTRIRRLPTSASST